MLTLSTSRESRTAPIIANIPTRLGFPMPSAPKTTCLAPPSFNERTVESEIWRRSRAAFRTRLRISELADFSVSAREADATDTPAEGATSTSVTRLGRSEADPREITPANLVDRRRLLQGGAPTERRHGGDVRTRGLVDGVRRADRRGGSSASEVPSLGFSVRHEKGWWAAPARRPQ